MKTLTKVKLINWHTFVNETFEVYHNTLMTGENSTGKSTILDALQYVLTVGKCKFNKAASDIGNRTLESYIRCKTGKEGQEYERNGDVTCYIALEFYDEKTHHYQVIGAAIDVMSGTRPIRDFFQVVNARIDDIVFIEKQKVLTRKQFKSKVLELNLEAYFKDVKRDAEKLFSIALGVKTKYFELVSRALAFKAIDNVYQFIMDFLLKEDFVDINYLRQSILHYQQLEEQLKVSKNECDTLAQIAQHYENFQQEEFEIKAIQFAGEKVTEKSILHDIDQATKKMSRYRHRYQQNNTNLRQIDEQYDFYRKQLDQLEASMHQNETYRLKASLDHDFKMLNKEKNRNENKYKDIINKLKQEARLYKKLRIQKKFIEYIEKQHYDSHSLNELVPDAISFVNDKADHLKYQIHNQKMLLKKNNDDYSQCLEQYHTLKSNQFAYRKEVQGLIDLLKEKLSDHYGKDIEVKPLCEYIEVKDETWRNALEGYLNTQRFDLIIDPEYFSYALLIYEEYKKQRGIFGVGIVDVAKLKKYGDIDIEGTLAEQLICRNTYAKWYINMLLKNVICVDDARELRHHRTAITKSVMLYKNYTVRALNPRIYQTPYIGYHAIKIQLESLEKQLSQLQSQIDQDKNTLDHLQNNLELLSQSQIQQLFYQIDIIDEYQLLVKQLQDIQNQIDSLKLDDSLLALQEEYEKAYLQFEDIKKQKRQVTEEIGKIEFQISDLSQILDLNQQNQKALHETIVQYESDHIDITQRADQLIIDYEKQYFRDFKNILKVLEQNSIRINKTISELKNKTEMMMNSYNHEFNIGFENSIDDIQSYLQRYYQLRDMDIVEKTEKTRQAKLKCEESFKTSFISGLHEKIENAKRDISVLNKGLTKRNFNGETYEFVVTPTRKDNFKNYYKIIQTGKDYFADNLLSETLDDSQRRIMDELFTKLSAIDNNKETEKMLKEYTDYRNYLDYDIKINYDDGTFAYFSKVNKEKSGGETQTPFYVIMAASFEQIIQNRNLNEDFGCMVLLDEAFNNMDERRIQEMIQFYNERDIQTFIVVPPSRAATIIPYVNTRLLVIRQNNHSFVEIISDER